MMRLLRPLDGYFKRLKGEQKLAIAVGAVPLVGGVDYITGYEMAMSLFYLAPVAMAAWYSGRLAGSAVSILCCMSWLIADLASGHQYTHPALPFWNTFVRLSLFYITGLLLTELRTSLDIQERLARTDELTGLSLRREFDSRLKQYLATAQRTKSPLTLAYVDLDDFKAVNDTHGHAGGDRVLKVIGQVLNSSIREVDTAARLGGDEFALILPDTDASGARQAMTTIASKLHETLESDSIPVTCSIGVITISQPNTSAEHAVAAADKLMYQVKLQGKGSVAFSTLGDTV